MADKIKHQYKEGYFNTPDSGDFIARVEGLGKALKVSSKVIRLIFIDSDIKVYGDTVYKGTTQISEEELMDYIIETRAHYE